MDGITGPETKAKMLQVLCSSLESGSTVAVQERMDTHGDHHGDEAASAVFSKGQAVKYSVGEVSFVCPTRASGL